MINSKNETVENSNCVDYELLLARKSPFYMGKFWQKVAWREKGLARAQPPIFPYGRRARALCVTGGHLG